MFHPQGTRTALGVRTIVLHDECWDLPDFLLFLFCPLLVVLASDRGNKPVSLASKKKEEYDYTITAVVVRDDITRIVAVSTMYCFDKQQKKQTTKTHNLFVDDRPVAPKATKNIQDGMRLNKLDMAPPKNLLLHVCPRLCRETNRDYKDRTNKTKFARARGRQVSTTTNENKIGRQGRAPVLTTSKENCIRKPQLICPSCDNTVISPERGGRKRSPPPKQKSSATKYCSTVLQVPCSVPLPFFTEA